MDGARLRALQLGELEILLEFRRLCEENGLRYYLTGGTLLGAVRHKGFIPWDDDIDVVMPREDYKRFAQLCRQQVLSQNYYYQSSETASKYTFFFAKLKKRPMRPDEAAEGYIDIFALDKCPDWDWLAALFFKGIELCSMSMLEKVDPEFVCGYKRWYMRFLWKALSKLPLHWLIELRNVVCKGFGWLSSGKRVCNVGGLYGFPKEVCNAEWFLPKAELEFEGQSFSVPAGWHELLSNMYGDYMTPPDQTGRHGHFL